MTGVLIAFGLLAVILAGDGLLVCLHRWAERFRD